MARIKAVQTDFSNGEVSERVQGQIDKEFYGKSLSECVNFEPVPQGSLRLRGGFHWATAGVSDKVRLFTLKTKAAGTFLLELTPLELRIRDTVSMALQLNGPDIMVNGQFDSNLTGWYEGPHAAYSGPYLRAPGDYGAVMYRAGYGSVPHPVPFVRVKNAIAVTPGTNYRLSFEFVKKIGTNSGNLRFKLGSADHASDIATQVFTQPGNCFFDFNSGALAAVHIKFEREGDYYNTIYGDVDYSNGVVIDNVQLREVGAGATVIATPWDAEHLRKIQFAPEMGADRAYFAHPNVQPYRVIRNADGTWTLATLASLLGSSLPPEWAGSSWPSVAALAQSRLFLAGTPNEGHRVWGSAPGSPHVFAAASGGIDIKLATAGQIQWMKYGRVLLAGSEEGEHSISGSSGALGGADMHVKDESAFGAGPVQAVHAGPLALYVSHDLQKIRAALYDQQSDGWNSRDITFLADHILEGGVRELHFARAPFGSIVALREDKTLALCTFNPAGGTAGWWTLDTDGDVLSAAVADTGGSVFLWAYFKRGDVISLERKEWSLPDFFMDAYVVTDLTAGQVVVPGHDHLVGKTVRVVLDGVLEPDQVVAADGSVTLERAGSRVAVGLGYRAKAVTLPPPEAIAGKARSGQVFMLLGDSALPLVNGERAEAERLPAHPMDEATPNTSERTHTVTLGWGANGRITIEQDLPLKTEVLGLYAAAAANEV